MWRYFIFCFLEKSISSIAGDADREHFEAAAINRNIFAESDLDDESETDRDLPQQCSEFQEVENASEGVVEDDPTEVEQYETESSALPQEPTNEPHSQSRHPDSEPEVIIRPQPAQGDIEIGDGDSSQEGRHVIEKAATLKYNPRTQTVVMSGNIDGSSADIPSSSSSFRRQVSRISRSAEATGTFGGIHVTNNTMFTNCHINSLNLNADNRSTAETYDTGH